MRLRSQFSPNRKQKYADFFTSELRPRVEVYESRYEYVILSPCKHYNDDRDDVGGFVVFCCCCSLRLGSEWFLLQS